MVGSLGTVVATAGEVRADRPVLFELDVLPILSKAGCNSGACHGKSRGQNGFAPVAVGL